MKCLVPGCKHNATMIHPKSWCDKHWSMWFKWGWKIGKNKPEPKWMELEKDGTRKSKAK